MNSHNRLKLCKLLKYLAESQWTFDRLKQHLMDCSAFTPLTLFERVVIKDQNITQLNLAEFLQRRGVCVDDEQVRWLVGRLGGDFEGKVALKDFKKELTPFIRFSEHHEQLCLGRSQKEAQLIFIELLKEYLYRHQQFEEMKAQLCEMAPFAAYDEVAVYRLGYLTSAELRLFMEKCHISAEKEEIYILMQVLRKRGKYATLETFTHELWPKRKQQIDPGLERLVNSQKAKQVTEMNSLDSQEVSRRKSVGNQKPHSKGILKKESSYVASYENSPRNPRNLAKFKQPNTLPLRQHALLDGMNPTPAFKTPIPASSPESIFSLRNYANYYKKRLEDCKMLEHLNGASFESESFKQEANKRLLQRQQFKHKQQSLKQQQQLLSTQPQKFANRELPSSQQGSECSLVTFGGRFRQNPYPPLAVSVDVPLYRLMESKQNKENFNGAAKPKQYGHRLIESRVTRDLKAIRMSYEAKFGRQLHHLVNRDLQSNKQQQRKTQEKIPAFNRNHNDR